MKSCLITGGTGFMGSTLVRRLIQTGHQVRVLDNNSRGFLRRLRDLEGHFEFVEGDIRDADSVERACRNMHSVFHLASINDIGVSIDQPDLVLDIGVRGILNVLEGCKKSDVHELILASSPEVYQTPPRIPTDEQVPLSIPDPLNPRYAYAGVKIISELITLHSGRDQVARTLIFRPHNVYGPDMGREELIPQTILKLKKLSKAHPKGTIQLPIQGTGNEMRAFCYIDDFADGIECMLSSGKNQGIYHIGTQDERSIRNVVEEIAHHFGREIEICPGKIKTGPSDQQCTLRRCPDISKLAALGYKPKVSFEEGIKRTIEWCLKNP